MSRTPTYAKNLSNTPLPAGIEISLLLPSNVTATTKKTKIFVLFNALIVRDKEKSLFCIFILNKINKLCAIKRILFSIKCIFYSLRDKKVFVSDKAAIVSDKEV